MPRMLWVVLVVWIAAGQTQIDLSTQAKNVPIKSGASLPNTCAVGQIFFLSGAPTGANLYGCTAVNTWSAQGGQASSMMQGTLAGAPKTCTAGQTYFATDASAGANLYGCSAANTWTSEGGSETVASNGVTVGSRPTTNFLTGVGLISVITDTGTEINIQSALDTAVVATLPGEQTGSSLLCGPTSGSANSYECSMTPTATAYTLGMVLHWIPNVNGAGGATTLNVDSLGATSVKQADGVSDPSATDIVAASMREVWYDGVNFRFLGTGSGQTSGGGSGPVQSVFGRTGAVTAANGDYAASQVTNAVATNSSNTFTAGTQDFSGAAHTRPMIVVSSSGSLPAVCAVGELAFVSGAAAGQQIYECSAADVWTQQSGGGGGTGGGTAQAPVFSNYANRPACNGAATGTRFFAKEISNKEWQCDGTTWQPIAFGMQVVEPTALTWSTEVGGGPDTPSIANVAGAVQLSANHSTVSGYAFQGMMTPLAMTAPYTIEIAFTLDELSAGQYSACQFGVANGTSPSSIFFGIGWSFSNGIIFAPTLNVLASQFNAIGGGSRIGLPGMISQPVTRVEMVDDGTNRGWYYNSGSGYKLLYSESDTTDISSPNYWGIGCTLYSAGDQVQLTLYHASVHH
ncbi:MAG: hypothetical protein ABSE35_17070 [Bryobacteraceae bacterium]